MHNAELTPLSPSVIPHLTVRRREVGSLSASHRARRICLVSPAWIRGRGHSGKKPAWLVGSNESPARWLKLLAAMKFVLTFLILAVTVSPARFVRAQSAATKTGEDSATGYRASYYKNGELHISVLGTPETKPVTSGHWDFKPSWSRTGDMLVFFRRLKVDPDVNNWITKLCIIHTDGTGYHELSDGTFTDFNPTWSRDGSNTPLWNRKVPGKVSYYIMAGKVGGKPGEEIQLTGKGYHSWVHSTVRDGRLLVSATPPKLGRGYYLMTPNAGGEPRFERVECELADKGILDRISISPGETKICFEYQTGFKYTFPGRTLYHADFDVKQRKITNLKPFANAEKKNVWFAYPRWTKDEAAIVYHAGGKLFLHTLADGSTRQVSTDDKADYRYPFGEAAPN